MSDASTFRCLINNYLGNPYEGVTCHLFRVLNDKGEVIFSAPMDENNKDKSGYYADTYKAPMGFDDYSYEFHALVDGKQHIARGYVIRNLSHSMEGVNEWKRTHRIK